MMFPIQCVKQTTVAVIMKNGKFISSGANFIKNAEIPIRGVCPREYQGFPTGQGYHLCKEVCSQDGHAEAMACSMTTKEVAEGATLYLIGHTYACDDCISKMKEIGIKELVICDLGKTILI